MTVTLKPLEFTLEYNSNRAELSYDAGNVQPFETILDTFEYKDFDNTEWKSKYNHYVVYDYEPFCSDGFMKHRYLEFKSEQHVKFFLHLLTKHIDNIKQAQISYNTNREINNYDETN